MSAQFLNQKVREPSQVELDGFAAMGQPVPFYRQQAAYEHATSMGCEKAAAHSCVGAMAEALARDKPYEAMEAGMRYVDLTGTYRLMAVLLTSPEPVEAQKGPKS